MCLFITEDHQVTQVASRREHQAFPLGGFWFTPTRSIPGLTLRGEHGVPMGLQQLCVAGTILLSPFHR